METFLVMLEELICFWCKILLSVLGYGVAVIVYCAILGNLERLEVWKTEAVIAFVILGLLGFLLMITKGLQKLFGIRL